VLDQVADQERLVHHQAVHCSLLLEIGL